MAYATSSSWQVCSQRGGACIAPVPPLPVPPLASDIDGVHQAAGALIGADLGMALLVSGVHTVAMIAAGGFLAWLVYRYLGTKFVSRSWFNLDATWAVSLIVVGALSLAISLASQR